MIFQHIIHYIKKESFFTLLSILFSIALLLTIKTLSFAESTAPIPLVKTSKVKLENINPPDKYIGHIEAIESVKIIARVTGYLEKTNFKEGSIVKENQLLYVIEQPPYLARVSANRGLVEQAKADVFRANQKLSRLLAAQPESVPATDLDDAKAQKQYAAGVLQEAQANLKLALIDLDYTTIHAPITGRIGKTTYTKGNLVGPNSEALAEIMQMDPIRVVFSVTENNVPLIEKILSEQRENESKNNLAPEIRFPNGTKYHLRGKIDFIDNKVDPQTGTIAIWVEFKNPDGELIPGEYVTVLLTISEENLKITVPQVAVQIDNKGYFVFIVNKDNIVEERRIETDKMLGDKWVLTGGLKEGDTVIVQGIQKVKPGMKVNITTEDVERKQ